MEPRGDSAETSPKESARPSFGYRLALALSEVVLIILAAAILVRLPLPLLDDWLPVKNVVVAIGAVVMIGKTLFDTLFFDRYWP